MGQQRRLVIAPAKQAQAVERHRHHQVGIGRERAGGPGQPGAVGRRRMDAVAMLETQHQVAGSGIVAEHGAGAGEGRRVAQAGAAKGFSASAPLVELERRAAAGANRWRDKGDLGPTPGAERALTADHHSAFQALLGEQQVEHGAQGGAKGR